MVNIKLNMTYKVGDPVSVEWEKLQKFLFRKEILEVSCQQGNFQPIHQYKKQVCLHFNVKLLNGIMMIGFVIPMCCIE